ncbi:helicase-related protein [Helicobacter pylori]|uniref:helicase-related protein n=1 Tax=Helicobacter pylori TaxID=210 RepID=UPI00267C37DC
MNDLTSAELNPLSSDFELENKRAKLNLVYDGFVKKFGYLNENRNRKDIKQDLYGAKVIGLEKDFEKEITPRSAKKQNIEPRQAQAKKAQIFFERTLNPKKELIITNAKEALIASINQKGGLDLHFIRDHFTTQSLEATIKELLEQKLIYKDHKDNGDYILANDYLSGNVKRKLKEVKEAINQGVEGLEANLKDLELIIPKDLKATEIMANINSPWIPTQYLEEFLMELASNHYEKQYGDKMTDYQLGNLKENIKVEHVKCPTAKDDWDFCFGWLKHNPHFVPKVYEDKPINVVVKRSEEVAQFIGVADENGKYNEGSIIDRMQKCEGKKNKKGQDNILSCTTDARKVALDYRLIDPNAKVEKEFFKSYAMAENIYENYLETHATKGTQLGFIGLSTPKTHSQKVSLEALDNAHETENKNPLDETQELLESLSSYDENGNLIAPSQKELENELKEKKAKSVNLDEELAKGSKFDVYSDVLRHLVQMGIPQNEIAFIHDAKTEEQKQDLFKKLNRGAVRVLLGSPAKMGVGTNVQERLVAMHELDCPWRPDELLQMEGRGIRQGNILHQNDPENFRMKIYRYATEKTYDSRMWQIIETKSKGIEQFRNAHKLGLNELEDFNMGSSNASEMKAEATGNPLIIEEVKLRAEIKSEESKYKAFNKENYFNEENLKNNSSKMDYLKQELKDLETLQSSIIIPTHTEIRLYDLKNEESKDYELIKVKEVEPLKENASMSEELTHKKLKEQNKQIAEQNKEKLDAIKKQFASNLNDLFFNEERDCKLLEYKGFVVNAYKTKYQVEFSLSPKDNPNVAYSPSNMVYKNDTSQLFSSYNFCAEIKFDGFLKRLDNAITKLPEKIKELENSIETTKENIAKYTRLVEQKPSYPRLEYLQALKWDHKTLIDDLAKMGKDRDYKPVFNPKSKEVLENLNAEKRASLVDESVTEEVKEQANQEAYKPMKKAANDDYDMGM